MFKNSVKALAKRRQEFSITKLFGSGLTVLRTYRNLSMTLEICWYSYLNNIY